MRTAPDFLLIGLGVVGRGVLRYLEGSVIVVDHEPVWAEAGPGQSITWICAHVDRDNHAALLEQHSGRGTIVIETANHIGTRDIAAWCHENGRHFVNTVADLWLDDLLEWSDGYRNIDGLIWRLLEPLFALHDRCGSGPTSVVMQGANTGMVNHFLKRAIDDLARERAVAPAAIAQRVREAYVLEKDTLCFRAGFRPEPGVFYNTWNIKEFILESAALCEFPENRGRRVHERPLQRDVMLGDVALKGRLVPHEETFTMAWWLAKEHGNHDAKVQFLYEASPVGVYSRMRHPFGDDYVERTVVDEIDPDLGFDLVGTLILLDDGSNWFTGHCMGNDVARRFHPETNATAWFVSAGVLAAIAWIRAEPDRGFRFPEFADHDAIIAAFLRLADPAGFVSRAVPGLVLSPEYPDVEVANLFATGQRVYPAARSNPSSSQWNAMSASLRKP